VAVPRSKSEEILELSKELLDDIELSRLSAESLLLKAARLARLTDSELWSQWIAFELQGYNGSDEAFRLGTDIGRVTDAAKRLGHWGPLAAIEADIAVAKLRLEALRVPDISLSITSANPSEYVTGTMFAPKPSLSPQEAIDRVLREAGQLTARLATRVRLGHLLRAQFQSACREHLRPIQISQRLAWELR
jgi:hypothetical protein